MRNLNQSFLSSFEDCTLCVNVELMSVPFSWTFSCFFISTSWYLQKSTLSWSAKYMFLAVGIPTATACSVFSRLQKTDRIMSKLNLIIVCSQSL